VRISRADLDELGKGELNPMTAVMTGRMKLSDMALAMALTAADPGPVREGGLRRRCSNPPPSANP
jgi:hypothetical protein